MMIEKENTEQKRSLAQGTVEAAEAEEVGLEAEIAEEAAGAVIEADLEVKSVEEERAVIPEAEVEVIIAETREVSQVQTAETK